MSTTAPPQKILVPAAPPRVLEDVYRDDEYERMLEVVKREGPWGTIISHHFTVGRRGDRDRQRRHPARPRPDPRRHRRSALPRVLRARTRCASIPSSKTSSTTAGSSTQVKSYWNAEYAKPTLMLFNICGPHNTGLAPHLDAVTFRGVRIENTPVWLQNIMGKSGLFTDYLVKMAQVITWWYRGSPGGFTYWPDGPFEPPQRLEAPMWNRGVVVQNEMMYHRGDPVGPPADRAIEGVKNRSVFGYDAADDIVGRHDRRRRDPPVPARADPLPRALERRGVCRHGRGQEGHGPHRRPHPRTGRRHAARRHARPGRAGGRAVGSASTTSTSSRR